jgi:hypothetical protein
MLRSVSAARQVLLCSHMTIESQTDSFTTISAEALASATGGLLMTPSFHRTAVNQSAWQRTYTKGIAPNIHQHLQKLPPNPDVHGRW